MLIKFIRIILPFILISLMTVDGYAAMFTFYKIVDTSTSIPDGKGFFTSFNTPVINKNSIVFRGFGIENQSGIYDVINGKLIKIADTYTAIPAGSGNFIQFGSVTPPPNDNINKYQLFNYSSPSVEENSVVFTAAGKSNQAGIYLYRNNELIKIADENTPIPQGEGNIQTFSSPYLINGKTGFTATGNSSQFGIFIWNGNRIQMQYNQLAKPQDNSNKFIELWNPDFSEQYVAFRGRQANGNIGIYIGKLGEGNKVQTIADKNTLIPEGVGKFINFGAPSLSQNEVAFRGMGENSQEGIYATEEGKLIAVATLQTAIPEGHGNFTGLFNPTIDHHNVVFIGTGTDQQQGIYLYKKSQLYKIIATPNSLQGKSIQSLELGAVAMSNNEIIFLAKFSDGSSGIYVARFT